MIALVEPRNIGNIGNSPEIYFCTKNTINCDNSMHKNKTFEYLEKKI